MTMQRNTRGFTLIELMIVVAIVVILAAIAIPVWSRYGNRARRGDGQQLLLHIAQAQERYYTDYNKYTGDLTKLGYASSTAVTDTNTYTVKVALSSSSAQAYTATATPINQQAKDECGALSLSSTGKKLPSASDAAQNKNGRCW